MPGKIIDVSHHNGSIDWNAVRQNGVLWGFAKATEGSTYVDPSFKSNFAGLKSIGALNSMGAGAYHYFRGKPTDSSAKQQADHIENTLLSFNFNKQSDTLAIDVEIGNNEGVSKDEMTEKLLDLLTRLSPTLFINNGEDSSKGFHKVIIYTSAYNWDNMINREHDEFFSKIPLWVAHYNTKKPRIPATWADQGKSWKLWQFTDKGKLREFLGILNIIGRVISHKHVLHKRQAEEATDPEPKAKTDPPVTEATTSSPVTESSTENSPVSENPTDASTSVGPKKDTTSTTTPKTIPDDDDLTGDTTTHAYLGIPYAKPPVGDRRLEKPQAIDRRDIKIKSLQLPNGCYQQTHLFRNAEDSKTYETSEDCLYLNILKPAKTEHPNFQCLSGFMVADFCMA
uniref:Carboxylesterase type B domain-containing protein n=1 Tax=Ditylenchus dipsaci TaxID=166011 RepID=A0A915DZK7_9BILA